jgi:hypothetical protein
LRAKTWGSNLGVEQQAAAQFPKGVFCRHRHPPKKPWETYRVVTSTYTQLELAMSNGHPFARHHAHMEGLFKLAMGMLHSARAALVRRIDIRERAQTPMNKCTVWLEMFAGQIQGTIGAIARSRRRNRRRNRHKNRRKNRRQNQQSHQLSLCLVSRGVLTLFEIRASHAASMRAGRAPIVRLPLVN